jgi:plastocyanin
MYLGLIRSRRKRMRQRITIMVLGALLLALMVGTVFVPAAGAHTGAPEEVGQNVATITIRDSSFDPAQITVAPGTTVLWVVEDEGPYNVTAEDGSFASPALYQGYNFSFTFREAGTLAYFNALQPSMSGSVIVGERGA